MKFSYSKLSIAMLMAMGLTACGGGGSGGNDPQPDPQPDPNPVVSKVDQLVYFNIGDGAISSAPASSTSTGVKVCLDLNDNGVCEQIEIGGESSKTEGSVSLHFYADEFNKHLILVTQESKGVTYAVKASSELNSDGGRKPVFVNALTNLSNSLGLDNAVAILGEEARNSLDPYKTPTGSKTEEILQQTVESFAFTSPKINKADAEKKLKDAYKNIEQAVNKGLDDGVIIDHILEDGDTSKLPSYDKPAPGNTQPVASFEVKSNEEGVVTFTNKSSDADGDALTYRWSFGDGTSSTDENPSHKYTRSGKYPVKLHVSDGKGGVHDFTFDLDVSVPDDNNAPVADFDFVANGLTVTFTDKSSDADGDKLQYAWDFGDDFSSSQASPKHTYQKEGTYTVVLKISDGKAEPVTLPKSVTVKKANPPVGVTLTVDSATASEDKNGVVEFNSGVTYTGTETLTYKWDFGDGQTSNNAKEVIHTYTANGTYQAKLTVTDASGKVDSKDISVVVKNINPDNPPVVVLEISSAKGGVDNNGTVAFTSAVNYSGSNTLAYKWDFGDGKTSTEANPSHLYAKNGTYTVTLTVTDGSLSSKPTTFQVPVVNVSVPVPPDPDNPEKPCEGQDNQFCYNDIDGKCTKQECKDVTEEVCTVQGGAGLKSIETEYYATNPKGQVGKNKTISSMSDWTTDMIVAQGAANDDPRAYRGYHEKATDFYALYAAWDDTNLYLMVEMPNIQGQETCGDYDYSCDQFLPMGIGIRTGKRPVGNGEAVGGEGVWTKTPFYDIKDGIDTMLMFHPRLNVNKPGLFKTNADGLFSYSVEDGSLTSFTDAGIERVVAEGHVSPNFWGIPDNGNGTVDNYKTKEYSDLLKDNANGHLYQITIPLASLDITKSDIENSGIGVMAFSTFGESMMDALPWTPNLVDVASEAYSADESTSHEKEDFDEYDVRLASVGKLVEGAGERVCTTQTKQVCEEVELPASECGTVHELELYLTHEETDASGYVKSNVSWATGFTGVTYSVEANGQTTKLTYNQLQKTISFKKGDTARNETVKVTASNADGTKSVSKDFTVAVPACGPDECQVQNNPWVVSTGDVASNVFVDDGTESTCKLPAGALAIKADVAAAPTVYAYTSAKKDITAAWPGDTTKQLDGCDSKFWTISGLTDTDLFIISNADGERYPADMQPGVEYKATTPCFDFASKKSLSADECGISGEIGADAVYAQQNGTKLSDGAVVKINAKDGAPESEYVDIALMLYGKGVKSTTTGTYTIDGEEYNFTNGEIVRIGKDVAAPDTEAGEEPAELKVTLKYNDATTTFTVKKSKWVKPTASTSFSWDNLLVYFVMTDRFSNGDTSNDNSYGRPSKDSKGNATATFHGGDIVGMTKNLDYIKSLGMNAIWITAPYEQSHGWTGGGSSGAFAHYAYHGYYALDFTSMDANMGTVDEFRTFVNEAHKRGIRVVLDVVMNHSGYATLKDMCDYGFGVTSDGWDACTDWVPSDGKTFHNKPISEKQDAKWDAWWGKSWLIFGGYGEECGSGDGLDACISFLPDFKNSQTHGTSVSIPTFLAKKWGTPDAKHDIPAAKPYRSGNMTVAEFQAHWLASWVEEFGIDGFRCDTAKHVTKSTWKLLKEYSEEALEKWRTANKGSDPAADWTSKFWMTGEHWGYKTDETDGGGYASQGGFDSMINFSFNGQAKGGTCSVPTASTWADYAGKYGLGGTSPKLNALSYVSSHDTSLCRPSDMKGLGTYLELLPGGVQVYYGDETGRKNDNGGSGNDAEHGTRSDMNFPSDISSQAQWAAGVDTLSTKFSSDATLAHWQKVGQFRYRNVAVGAGKQTAIDSNTFCRTYDNGEITNSVVIHVGADSSVAVGACFDDGTELQDAYSGATVTVSGGKVTIPTPGALVLLELKR